MSKSISITIPCYNQAKLLKRNLEYLRKQSDRDFDIVLLDDNSTEDYQEIISQFPDFNISYIKNKKNVGAIRNIFNSIFYKTHAQYTLSLHEDDILHTDYIKKVKEILDTNPDIIFVVTIANWFKDDTELQNKFSEAKNISNIRVLSKIDFIRAILDNKHVTFGSVVYRNSYLNEKPDFTAYDVLCDRPFLISLIKDKKIGLIQDKAIYVRDHGEIDNRFVTITEENCLNLMNCYKNNLPSPLDNTDAKKLLTFSTNNLIGAYAGLKNKQMSFYQFIQKGKKLGLIDLTCIRMIGIAGLIKLFFGKKVFHVIMKLK